MERDLANEAADAIDTLFEAALSDRPVSTPDLRRFLQVADELREHGEYAMPEVGDVVRDPVTYESWQNEEVEVVEIPGSIAACHSIEVDGQMGTRYTTVAAENVNEPADAPVVIGRYVGGSKRYAFPVTRLEF